MADDPLECPLCGRSLRPNQHRCSCGAIVREKEPEKEPLDPSDTFDHGAFLPWIPLAACLLLLVWVLPTGPTGGVIQKLFKVAALTILSSSMLALLDAERISRMDWQYGPSRYGRLSPLRWFSKLVLMWPVTFPAFLRTHYLHADPVRMKRGVLTTTVFLVLFVGVALYTTTRKAPWERKQTAAATNPASIVKAQKPTTDPSTTTTAAASTPKPKRTPSTTATLAVARLRELNPTADSASANVAELLKPIGASTASGGGSRSGGGQSEAATESKPAFGVSVPRPKGSAE